MESAFFRGGRGCVDRVGDGLRDKCSLLAEERTELGNVSLPR